jgi:hypothetical protein
MLTSPPRGPYARKPLPLVKFTHETLDNATLYDATQQLSLNKQMAVSQGASRHVHFHRRHLPLTLEREQNQRIW